MTASPTDSVATRIRRLAEAHHVKAESDDISHMAVTITRLTSEAVELDEVERLLVNLKKVGVLSKSEILILQGEYLQERRRLKKRFVSQ